MPPPTSSSHHLGFLYPERRKDVKLSMSYTSETWKKGDLIFNKASPVPLVC